MANLIPFIETQTGNVRELKSTDSPCYPTAKISSGVYNTRTTDPVQFRAVLIDPVTILSDTVNMGSTASLDISSFIPSEYSGFIHSALLQFDWDTTGGTNDDLSVSFETSQGDADIDFDLSTASQGPSGFSRINIAWPDLINNFNYRVSWSNFSSGSPTYAYTIKLLGYTVGKAHT